jgi:phosphoribosylamine--glycine ligase
MKVLVVGSGGREHALAWKIAQSPLVERVFCAPGNAGTSQVGENVSVEADDIPGLTVFASENRIDLTVVGPEQPLVAGIVDEFEKRKLGIFGANRAAARLEGSKVFAKQLMRKHAIPTAEFQVFDDASRATKYLANASYPLVVKADGLAAGKGALLCPAREEAEAAVKMIMVDRRFGDSGRRVVIEECLVGEEASIIAFTDGTTIYITPSSQDHKPIYDGDRGPNTGGMGAYSPAPVITEAMLSEIERRILVPILHALRRERIIYRGVIYAGLMITAGGPKVLEFNVRFGDPETQPVLPRLESDLVPALLACVEGRLEDADLAWDQRAAVCVVMASEGYPGSYETGREIHGLESVEALEDVIVFHAGTRSENERVLTAGGRVLGVTALGSDLKDAQARAYQAVEKISFEGAYYRTDIGSKAFAHLCG